ncbi:hypothetical protein [Terriglobus tenax]|uniref:hypothetical protein n=1 Tax=Terriglobus tenax TaxID=1111115 RepID=UPI0021E074F4|nr:hypothetical protein [Terriglobus tenax]
MSAKSVIELLEYVDPILCLVTILALIRAKQVRAYFNLLLLLSTKVLADGIALVLLNLHGVDKHVIYRIYFYTYWTAYALEAILSILVIYSIFKLAMEPLKGLQSLGLLVFRWAAAISVAVAVGMAFGPNMSSTTFIISATNHLQRTQSILTLCLLLFVCFAIRPMGLSHRSRIFGVSLGLGMLSTVELVNAAWLTNTTNMFSAFSVIRGVAISLAFATWAAYFFIPEPQRRMIVLPTTSPFLKWNQVSLALGHDPGFVVVGSNSPDLFAPAELEIIRRSAEKSAPLAIAN